LICDTGGLINGLVTGQHLHEECLNSINDAATLVLSPLVLCEIEHVTTSRHGSSIASRILTELAEPEYEMATFDSDDLHAALDVMGTYKDLSIGLTDASLVVLAKRYKTNEILTLDQRHFRAIRGFDGRHFKLLPYDA
jgi:predicted nucleic acid-binding protein